jgi:hypothetical protein
MRWGCIAIWAVLVGLLGMVGTFLWVSSRLLQEPDVPAAMGSPDDGVRGQQKIFEILRAEPARRGGRAHQVVMTEAELNQFLSKHLVEAARMPVTVGALRLRENGIVELKALLSVRDLVSASWFMPAATLAPSGWLERRVWLHLEAKTSLEVGTSRSLRRHLRFDVQRFAIGRQPLPGGFLRLLPSPGLQGLFRWRLPDSIEGITVEPGAVAVRVAS